MRDHSYGGMFAYSHLTGSCGWGQEEYARVPCEKVTNIGDDRRSAHRLFKLLYLLKGGAFVQRNGVKMILVAEDNPDDALIFKMKFKRAALPFSLQIVEDGQQVIDWLAGTGPYSDRAQHPIPDRILLDLKMPVKTGFEALEWIRSQKFLDKLPVAILSSSDDPKDVKRAFELGATKYFVKSPQLEDVMGYLRAN